jgi:hypothetical protein
MGRNPMQHIRYCPYGTLRVLYTKYESVFLCLVALSSQKLGNLQRQPRNRRASDSEYNVSRLSCAMELTTYPYATSLDARQWQTLLSLGTSTVVLRMSTWTTDSHSSLNGAGLKVMMVLDFGT